MMVLKLTNSAIAGDKPKLFITAAIHAREYTTAEMATRFAEYLVNNYGTNADATWILDHHEIHLMLQTNPDGRKEAEAGSHGARTPTRTTVASPAPTVGTDLNRNYAFKWSCCSGGSSGTPCNATYRGPSGRLGAGDAGRAELHGLRIFTDQRDASLRLDAAPATATGVYIDLHCYSQLVMWPWGFTHQRCAQQHAALQTLGRKLAYFNSYTPQKAVLASTPPTAPPTTTPTAIYGVASFCLRDGDRLLPVVQHL